MHDEILKLFLEHGLAVSIVLFACWMIYKYLNIRLDMMQKEFDKKLKDRVYRIEGNVNYKMLSTSNKIDIDLRITEQIADSSLK